MGVWCVSVLVRAHTHAYLCAHLCARAGVPVCAWVEARGLPPSLSILFFQTWSLTVSATIAGRQAAVIYLPVSATVTRCDRTLGIELGSQNPHRAAHTHP